MRKSKYSEKQIAYTLRQAEWDREQREREAEVSGGSMKTPARLSVVVLPLALASAVVYAAGRDVVTMQPERPIEGGTITLMYDTGAPDADLDPDQEIYASLYYWTTDHAHHRAATPLKQADGGLRSAIISVPPHAATLSVSFTTLRKTDRAKIQSMVYRSDGVPVRTAWEQSILTSPLPRDYLDRFEREKKLYPDNLAAYRNKWFVAGAYDRATVLETIEQDMRHLRRRVRGEHLEGLYALAVGYVNLGREDEARALVRRMVTLYPSAPLTSAAISDYLYHAYSENWETEGRDELAGLQRELNVAYPTSQSAREAMLAFARFTTLPLEAVEATAEDWMREEPDNPLPTYNLATVYESRGLKLDRAASLARRAVDGMLRGFLRPYVDPGGSLVDFYLPDACITAARIEARLDHLGLALGFVKTAEEVAKESDPDAWLVEAGIWDSLGDLDAAETAYLMAYRRGSKEAEDALRSAYRKRTGGLEGFKAHLGAIAGLGQAGGPERKPAPVFKISSPDGAEFDSASLRGKVLVLNFWGPGCGPCRAEIPDLNQLVERYRTQEVVFLALAGDDLQGLTPFLADHPFSYNVIPSAGRVFQAFDVVSLPVHIVVDRTGAIVARLTGAGETRAEQLARIIDLALAE